MLSLSKRQPAGSGPLDRLRDRIADPRIRALRQAQGPDRRPTDRSFDRLRDRTRTPMDPDPSTGSGTGYEDPRNRDRTYPGRMTENPDPHVVADGLLPTPFTAAEIRDALRGGAACRL